MPPLLAAAILAAPRRYRMPMLPATPVQARSAPLELALACALEHARAAPSAEVRELFLAALAALVDQALDAQAGDAAFQALVVCDEEPAVREFVRLQASALQDERTVRRVVDAAAHPARLARRPGAAAEPLAGLHALARAGDWVALARQAAGVLNVPAAGDALRRLARGQALRASPPVARYLALLRGQGPRRGSEEAGRQGRASARHGDAAEAAVVAGLGELAALLQARTGMRLRVARGLRTPGGFPGGTAKAKDEWDVALLGGDGPAADVVLLGEVKLAPAAAVGDYHRLLRGLQRLAQADAGDAYAFASGDGPVRLAGSSLRLLAPSAVTLPAHVLYFSTAPACELPVLSAAAKAVLLAEPASIAYARQRDARVLAAAWDALLVEPRLRAALHQYDTGRRACERMLHPLDLLAAARDQAAPMHGAR